MLTRMVRAGSVVGVAALAALAISPTMADSAEPTHGSAYAADAHVSLLKGILGPNGITVDTERLAATDTSGPTDDSTVDAKLNGLVTAKALSSSSHYDADAPQVESKASVVGASLPVLRSLTRSTPTASVISSQCTSTPAGITASSNLADVNLGSIGDVSAATPNLHVGVDGVVEVIANEQIHNADGSLTVNALHIKLLGGDLTKALGSGDIVLASSTCAAVASTPTTPTPPPTTAPPTDAPTTPPATDQPTPPAATTPSGGGAVTPTAPQLPSESPTQAPPQVSIVPAGAPQTGDGTLATQIVR